MTDLVAAGFGIARDCWAPAPRSRPRPPAAGIDVPLVVDVQKTVGTAVIRDTLQVSLDRGLVDLVSDTLAPDLSPGRPPARPSRTSSGRRDGSPTDSTHCSGSRTPRGRSER